MKDEAMLAQRLSRLESSLRRTQILAGALAVLACAFITAGAMQDPAKTPENLTVKKLTAELITAELISVRGGSIFTFLGADSDKESGTLIGAGVMTLRANGMTPKEDKSVASGPVLETHIGAGRVDLTVDGGGRSTLRARQDGAVLSLSALKPDGSSLSQVFVNALPDSAAVSVLDGTPKIRASLRSSGDASIYVADKSGQHRAVMGTTDTIDKLDRSTHLPESTLTLFDQEGRVLWQAPR